jgi:hypothetical protein
MSENPYKTPGEVGHVAGPRKGPWSHLAVKILMVVVVLGILVALLLPAQRSTREPSRRMSCALNLKQIALALQDYESTYHVLPPACTLDPQGKPLHSWRTLILPFMEQDALYHTIDLTKPWNDPANKLAFGTRVPGYECPSVTGGAGQTTYLAIVSPGSCLQRDTARRMAEVTDSPALTLVVVETDSAHSVHWMEPVDIDEETFLQRAALDSGPHSRVFQAAFLDGTARALDRSVPSATLKALISVAGQDDEAARIDE